MSNAVAELVSEALEKHTSGAKVLIEDSVSVEIAVELREMYRYDPRQLVSCTLSDRLSRLSCETIRLANEEDGQDTPALGERTRSPMYYFPEEIPILLERLKPHALSICDFPASDGAVIDVIGVSMTHGKSPGSIPKVRFKLRKQVLTDGHFWEFFTPKVYCRGEEGSLIVLPGNGEDLLEALRLHCLSALDGEFSKPVEQMGIDFDSTIEKAYEAESPEAKGEEAASNDEDGVFDE